MTLAAETTPIKQPLGLSKLTFLCGPPGHGQRELSLALADRDPDLGLVDFLEPIRLATAMLFFNGNFMHNDLTQPEVVDQYVLGDELVTYRDWMETLSNTMVDILGKNILGRIALKNMTEDGEIDNVFARHLFRDCHNLSDAAVFVDKFGPTNCLLIHIGPLTDSAAKGLPGTKNIWLPEPGLDARIRLLEHELSL